MPEDANMSDLGRGAGAVVVIFVMICFVIEIYEKKLKSGAFLKICVTTVDALK
jgi:hypothetical protein